MCLEQIACPGMSDTVISIWAGDTYNDNLYC